MMDYSENEQKVLELSDWLSEQLTELHHHKKEETHFVNTAYNLNKDRSYNTNMGLLDNVKTMAKRASGTRRDKIYTSFLHLNATSLERGHDIRRLHEACSKKGMFYFLSSRLRLDEETRGWSRVYEDDVIGTHAQLYAEINLVDKIKVYTTQISSANLSKQYVVNGLEGTQDVGSRCKKRPKGDKTSQNRLSVVRAPDVFLQDGCRCAQPSGTVARYRRNDNSFTCHAHVLSDNNINKFNINMTRGIHEYIVLNRTILTNNMLRTRDPLSVTARLVLRHENENNNSLTSDAVLNAVINGVTFKRNALLNGIRTMNDPTFRGFGLTSKAAFGTHKIVEPYEEDEQDVEKKDGMPLQSYHRRTPFYYIENDMEGVWKQVREAIHSVELQVHDYCMNSSAVPGSKLMSVICKKAGQLLHESNGKSITVSLALNNSKALIERMAHSLSWSLLNEFCDIMCWTLKTHTVSRSEEHKKFLTTCCSIIETMLPSRDNYAQATTFCQQLPFANKMYTEPPMRLLSHKFRNADTLRLYRRNPNSLSVNVESSNRKRPLTIYQCEHVRYNKDENIIDVVDQVKRPRLGGDDDAKDSYSSNKAYLSKTDPINMKCIVNQPSRNESIATRYAFGARCFRDNFDLEPPAPPQ